MNCKYYVVAIEIIWEQASISSICKTKSVYLPYEVKEKLYVFKTNFKFIYLFGMIHDQFPLNLLKTFKNKFKR